MNFLDEDIYAQVDTTGRSIVKKNPGFIFGDRSKKYLFSEAHKFQTLPVGVRDHGGSVYRLNAGFNLGTNDEPPQMTEPKQLKFLTDDLIESGKQPIRFETSVTEKGPDSDFLITNTQIDNNLYNVYPDGVRKSTTVSSKDLRDKERVQKEKVILQDLSKQIETLEGSGGIPAIDLQRLRDQRDELERKIDPSKAIVDSIKDLGKKLSELPLGAGAPGAGGLNFRRAGAPIITDEMATQIARNSQRQADAELELLADSINTRRMVELFETVHSLDTSFEEQKEALKELERLGEERSEELSVGLSELRSEFQPFMGEIADLVKKGDITGEEGVEIFDELLRDLGFFENIANEIDNFNDGSPDALYIKRMVNRSLTSPLELEWALAALINTQGGKVEGGIKVLRDNLFDAIENRGEFLNTEQEERAFIKTMLSFYGSPENQSDTSVFGDRQAIQDVMDIIDADPTRTDPIELENIRAWINSPAADEAGWMGYQSALAFLISSKDRIHKLPPAIELLRSKMFVALETPLSTFLDNAQDINNFVTTIGDYENRRDEMAESIVESGEVKEELEEKEPGPQKVTGAEFMAIDNFTKGALKDIVDRIKTTGYKLKDLHRPTVLRRIGKTSNKNALILTLIMDSQSSVTYSPRYVEAISQLTNKEIKILISVQKALGETVGVYLPEFSSSRVFKSLANVTPKAFAKRIEDLLKLGLNSEEILKELDKAGS